MHPKKDHSQLEKHYEEGWYKRLASDPVYAGLGANYYGYPAYIGAMAMYGGVTMAMGHDDQAQPDADSKMAGAAQEVGATGETAGGTDIGL